MPEGMKKIGEGEGSQSLSQDCIFPSISLNSLITSYCC